MGPFQFHSLLTQPCDKTWGGQLSSLVPGGQYQSKVPAFLTSFPTVEDPTNPSIFSLSYISIDYILDNLNVYPDVSWIGHDILSFSCSSEHRDFDLNIDLCWDFDLNWCGIWDVTQNFLAYSPISNVSRNLSYPMVASTSWLIRGSGMLSFEQTLFRLSFFLGTTTVKWSCMWLVEVRWRGYHGWLSQ